MFSPSPLKRKAKEKSAEGIKMVADGFGVL